MDYPVAEIDVIKKKWTFHELEEERRVMIYYAAAKLKSEDWHAVADAAMDLREIDAKIKILEEFRGEVKV